MDQSRRLAERGNASRLAALGNRIDPGFNLRADNPGAVAGEGERDLTRTAQPYVPALAVLLDADQPTFRSG